MMMPPPQSQPCDPVQTPPSMLTAPLQPEEIAAVQNSSKNGAHEKSAKTPMIPVPADGLPCNFAMPDFGGKPTNLYPYQQADGQLVGYVARWDIINPETGEREKKILPLCYCDIGNGKKAWRSAGMPTPRPLYRLPEILARQDAPIIVCEGEKTAEAAKVLFPDYATTTPMHGAKSPQKTDWSALRGRTVMIAPDYDAAGEAFADAVYDLCRKAGSIRILRFAADTLGNFVFTQQGKSRREGGIPEGYDLADALRDGWTADTIAQLPHTLFERPYIPVTELDTLQQGIPQMMFRLHPNGVEHRVEDKDGNDEWRWISSFLAITHQTRDANGGNWGRVLELIDNDGKRKEYVMPMAALAGDGVAYREALLGLGLRLAPSANKLLHTYITTCNPKKRATCVGKTGWHTLSANGTPCFVLPGKVYGIQPNERIVLQQEQVTENYSVTGTLPEWQQKIGNLCVGNSRLILAICAALSGPMLELLGEENFGVHLSGGSSVGKTTALHVATSVWGVPLASWRTTDNAAEALAGAANDTALFLDELSQVGGAAADAMAYMLGNGSGKARARRDGSARVPLQFRLVFLSTGEIGLASKMQECGKQAKAGQTVRFIEIAADAGKGYGLFENIHEANDGNQLSLALKDHVKNFRGSVGDAFLRALVEQRADIGERVGRARRRWVEEHTPTGSDGQVQRVAQKFGLIAAVGELAVHLGILPWPPEMASNACIQLLIEWVAQRGGTQSHEVSEVAQRLRSLIAQHGSSRFESPWIDGSEYISTEKIINRLGFRRLTPEKEWEYFLLPDTFDKEIIAGMAGKLVKEYLAAQGMILRDVQGKYTISMRVPGCGQLRLYHVPAGILEGGRDVYA